METRNETHYLYSKYTVIKLSKNEAKIKLLDQDHRQDEVRQILTDARLLRKSKLLRGSLLFLVLITLGFSFLFFKLNCQLSRTIFFL